MSDPFECSAYLEAHEPEHDEYMAAFERREVERKQADQERQERVERERREKRQKEQA